MRFGEHIYFKFGLTTSYPSGLSRSDWRLAGVAPVALPINIAADEGLPLSNTSSMSIGGRPGWGEGGWEG